jgi:hypothetical protein
VQYSVGHEGLHCLMVADDGSVFFAGVAKRGEDGDAGSLCKFSILLYVLCFIVTLGVNCFVF